MAVRWVRHKGRYASMAVILSAGLVVVAIVLLSSHAPTRKKARSARTSPGGEARCPATAQLSYVSTESGREQIFIVDPQRSASTRQLTDLPGFASDAAWSPDGRMLAFRWYRTGRTRPDVYVADADGSHPRLLVKQGAMPDWSPDGQSIVFANLRPGSRGISVVDVREALGGDPRIQLVTRTDDAIPEEAPSWSPDGGRIAFNSQRSGNTDVWIVNVDGTGLRNLTDGEYALDEAPTWSSEGSTIAFGSTRESSSQFGGDIYVMDADGTNVHRLTFSDSAYAPAWSPDGCWIAFNGHRAGRAEISMMRADGSELRHLVTVGSEPDGEPASACCPAWRVSSDASEG